MLNLEDFENEPQHIREWHRRIDAARQLGFRTLAHFGVPVAEQKDATTCILDEKVRSAYAARLRWFLHEFPQVDDILIYTYDQHAWLCSEFGPCPRCRGVPLHERLPGFLTVLIGAIQETKPGVRLWWEPWELSEGQILAIVNHMPPEHFGLIMHNTIAEVQFVNTTDGSFRNIARLAGRRGIPTIGEGFFGGSGEEVSPLTHLAVPRLVYQQLDARATPGE